MVPPAVESTVPGAVELLSPVVGVVCEVLAALWEDGVEEEEEEEPVLEPEPE